MFRVVSDPRQKLNRQEEGDGVKGEEESGSLGVVSLSTAGSPFKVFLGRDFRRLGPSGEAWEGNQGEAGKGTKTCKGDFHLLVFMYLSYKS